MAYIAPDSSKSENGFEYPDPESTFDVHSEHQTQMSGYPASSRQDCYPSPSSQAMYQAKISITEHSRQSSSSDPWQEEPKFGQVTPVFPYISTPPPILENASQHTKEINRGFVPNAVGRQQPRRGTTGKIVCADCGGKFTVMSSLNRHSKICRGPKKAWQPAWAQQEVSDADSESNLCLHPLAADERDSVSSEAVSSGTKFNSDVYNMPTKRTGSASHGTEDSILADKLSNYNSLTAESNWSPPGYYDEAKGLDGNFHTMPATNTSFTPSNAQSPDLTFGQHAPSPHPQKTFGTRSYVHQGGDTSANHDKVLCDVCYGTFLRRNLLQLHKASAHGLAEES